LILDETFDSSLDVGGTEEFMKILHMLEGVNLFVISHKGDILQDKFMNVIRFAKEKNFSKVMR
jgi:energy-coupling factor transporter ATP-binding protein EcfA2